MGHSYPGSDKERIWYVERTERGWSRPKPVAPVINAMPLHWQISVSAEGTLCFASEGDILCARVEDERYQRPERLGAMVNTAEDEGHPFIAPDESYLIFSAYGRTGGQGDYDLYISARAPDGSWSAAVNLGPRVNTPFQELFPVVSPDGKYLFFLSNRDRAHSVYWIDFASLTDTSVSSFVDVHTWTETAHIFQSAWGRALDHLKSVLEGETT